MITNELYDRAHAGDLEGVSNWLASRPQDLNTDISEGFTALHVACAFGHLDVVQFLISRGALVNANAQNEARPTPLHLATTFRIEETAEAMILLLLDHGAELNAKQRGGQTPLHHAVARLSERLVEVLVVEGADPFLKDDQGKAPTDLARDLGASGAIVASLKKAFSLPLEART